MELDSYACTISFKRKIVRKEDWASSSLPVSEYYFSSIFSFTSPLKLLLLKENENYSHWIYFQNRKWSPNRFGAIFWMFHEISNLPLETHKTTEEQWIKLMILFYTFMHTFGYFNLIQNFLMKRIKKINLGDFAPQAYQAQLVVRLLHNFWC